MANTRDNFVDVLRGLAILSIVQCHAAWVLPISGFPIGDFTCCFHVGSFLFLAGYLFRGIDRPQDLYRVLGKRLSKLWFLFFSYTAAYTLLNPLFLRLHIIPENQAMPLLRGLYHGLIMENEQPLLYTFWFVPMFLICTCVFSSGFCFCQQRKRPVLWHCLFAAFCTLAGIYGSKQQLCMNYYAVEAILVVPLLYLGYLARRYWEQISRFVNPLTAFPVAFLLLLLLKLFPGRIDLSSYQIWSPALFYPASALGIFMACGFAKGLCKVPILSRFLALAGRNSFHVMALHLLCFKLIDVGYGLITGASPEVYVQSPAAFDFWYVYLILGTLLSIAFAELGKRLYSRILPSK